MSDTTCSFIEVASFFDLAMMVLHTDVTRYHIARDSSLTGREVINDANDGCSLVLVQMSNRIYCVK